MNRAELNKLFDKLDNLRAEVPPLEKSLKACNLNGHQMSITVTVADVGTVMLTAMDRSYMQRLIRGRELIMLGVKKAISAKLDAKLAEILELEQSIMSAKVVP
jgi:hypothetical protein